MKKRILFRGLQSFKHYKSARFSTYLLCLFIKNNVLTLTDVQPELLLPFFPVTVTTVSALLLVPFLLTESDGAMLLL